MRIESIGNFSPGSPTSAVMKRRALEFVIVLAIIAIGQRFVSGAFHQPDPSQRVPSPARYAWGGGFFSYTLEAGAHQYEELYDDCTTSKRLVSRGSCRWDGDELVLTVGWIGPERRLVATPEGLVERAGLIYPREDRIYRSILDDGPFSNGDGYGAHSIIPLKALAVGRRLGSK
jgi:hypothetical protein